MAEEVRKARPRHVLEVGTLIGYSVILMGKELDSKSEIVTIEIHRDEVELAGKKIVRANILPKIKIITGDALIVNPTLRGQFDFVFIDAEKGEYFKYLMLAEGKLGRGAIVESSLTKWATIWIMFGTQASTKAATFRWAATA